MADVNMQWLAEVTRELMRFDDTSEILNRILLEARTVSHADAGTIFLKEGDSLTFAYTHNDTLFPVEKAHKYAYANAHLAITPQSIAGFCAVRREMVNIPDVRDLPPDVPYSFNDSFDNATGYRTVSVLCVPLVGRRDDILGVVQLINSQDEQKRAQPFTPQMENWLAFLAVQAVSALERSLLAMEMIHRMQKMAAYNDPKETAPHAERVGAISAEIYHRWAEVRDIPLDTRRAFRAHLRLAAMVHDLGKVAIPEEVLKKPGRLTDEEFKVMRTHCSEGARLFQSADLDIDTMSRDIALHHHQRWDGRGYTGSDEFPLLAGEDIPLAARIVAVADVLDALVSQRRYKEAWSWDKAVATIKEEAGSHFDPEVVAAFCEVQDIVHAIFDKFKDAA